MIDKICHFCVNFETKLRESIHKKGSQHGCGRLVDAVGAPEHLEKHMKTSTSGRAAGGQRVTRTAKSGDKDALAAKELLERVQAHLDQGLPVRAMAFNDAEQKLLKT